MLLNFAVVLIVPLTIAKLYAPVGQEDLSAKAPEFFRAIDLVFNLAPFAASMAGGYVMTRKKPAFKNTLVAGIAVLISLVFLFSLDAHNFSFPQHLWLLFLGFPVGGSLRSCLKRNRVLDSLQPPIPLP